MGCRSQDAILMRANLFIIKDEMKTTEDTEDAEVRENVTAGARRHGVLRAAEKVNDSGDDQTDNDGGTEEQKEKKRCQRSGMSTEPTWDFHSKTKEHICREGHHQQHKYQ